MLKAISTKNNSIETIKDLIFRLSPYSSTNLEKFNRIVDKFLSDEHYQHLESTGQTDTKTVPNHVYHKYFVLWRSLDRSKIYSGQVWISEKDVQKGLNFRKLEYYTT